MPQRVNGAAPSPWKHLHTITSCKNYILALTQQVQNMPSAVERGFPRSLYNKEQSASCSSLFAYACTLPLLWMHLRVYNCPTENFHSQSAKLGLREPSPQSHSRCYATFHSLRSGNHRERCFKPTIGSKNTPSATAPRTANKHTNFPLQPDSNAYFKQEFVS